MGTTLSEADLDARELERSTSAPMELDAWPPAGCTGTCLQGDKPCDCANRPLRSWREFFWLEFSNPWVIAVYAAVFVGSLLLSMALPGAWFGPGR